MVSDASLDELHDFAQPLGIPRRAFQGDHYDIPEEHRPAMRGGGGDRGREPRAGAPARGRRAAPEPGPAPGPRRLNGCRRRVRRAAQGADRGHRTRRHRGGSPSRSRGHHAVGGTGVAADDEPLEQLDAEVARRGRWPRASGRRRRAAGHRRAAPRRRRGRRRARCRRSTRRPARRRRARRRASSVPSTTTMVRPRRSSSRTSAIVSARSGRRSARSDDGERGGGVSIGSRPARGGRWAPQNWTWIPPRSGGRG